MKKQLFYLFTALFLVAGFSSCGDDDDDNAGATYTNTAFTDFDAEKLNQSTFADVTSIEEDFSFTSTEAWNIKIDYVASQRSATGNSWITVDPMSGGAGEHTITIKFDVNYTGKNRTAKVKLKAGESVVPINITQNAKTAEDIIPINPNPTYAKLITSVDWVSDNDEEGESDVYNFEYDSNNRLIKIVNTYTYGDEADMSSDIYTMTYTDSGFTLTESEEYEGETEEYGTSTYTLNAKGYISESSFVSDTKSYTNTGYATYTYNGDGYLNGVDHADNNAGSGDRTMTMTFNWSDGNLTEAERVRTQGEPEYTDITTHTRSYYIDNEDKMNLDLPIFMADISLHPLDKLGCLMRIYGKSSKDLLHKTGTATLTYPDKDADGFPTKIVITHADEYGDDSYSLIITYLST